MVWKCLNTACSVKLFSLSAEIHDITDKIISFFINLSGPILSYMVLFIVATLILYMAYYIKRSIMESV